MTDTIKHDISFSDDETTTNLLKGKNSTMQSNIMTVNAMDNCVNATHHIIPKFIAGTLYPTLLSGVRTFSNGSILIRRSMEMSNPQKAASIGGASQYYVIYPQLNQYFLDANGDLIRTEITAEVTNTTAGDAANLLI